MTWRVSTLALTLTALASCLAADNGAPAAPGPKAVSLFNGKDLTGWIPRGNTDKARAKSKWIVGQCGLDETNPAQFKVNGPAPATGAGGPLLLINTAGGVDLISAQTFKDCLVEIEFMIPKGSNSGIYLMGQYEVQILDSFGKAKEKLIPGDMGGIYKTAAPRVNACKPPGEWQKFVIDFQAPRFAEGKKIANARFVKVVFNEEVIHENVEPKGPTGTELQPGEISEGPLMIQGDHGPIAIKSVKVTAK